jgi:hypothetical protein
MVVSFLANPSSAPMGQKSSPGGGRDYAPISAINSATVFRTSSSVNSNSAATRLASATRAILWGREMGGWVGNGGGDSQVPPSTMFASGE